MNWIKQNTGVVLVAVVVAFVAVVVYKATKQYGTLSAALADRGL